MTSGPGPASIRVQRRIEWGDTDASGFHHNSATFRMVEMAETAMLDRLGIMDEVYGRLPRVRIEAEFRVPLAHRDLLDVILEVGAVGRTSVTYRFRIERHGRAAVEGSLVAVLLDRPGGRPTPWSDRHRELLLSAGPQPPELLVQG